jgi:hypothetical protein
MVRPTRLALALALATTASAAAAEPPRRWVYELTAIGDDGNKKPPVELTLVETGRKEDGKTRTLELAAEVGGKRLDSDRMSELGLASAPFETFGAKLVLKVGADKVTLTGGADAKWKLKDLKRKKPKNEPENRSFSFGEKHGVWQSVCQSFLHPSPDTGDYYGTTRCYAPGVGVTYLDLDSAWGGYELELVTPPADTGLVP